MVTIPVGSASLAGHWVIPPAATGLVLFAHGSGSSRYSPRNRYVAEVLQASGLATLLFDLLTQEEEAIDRQTRHLRFDMGLLTDRLIGITDWVAHNPATQGLKIGYFGASTGSAAALLAAAARPYAIHAIVSRGGRPDLARAALAQVKAPTLLIVGGLDSLVLTLNQQAYRCLAGEKRLEIVPGATHLFEEPGTLEKVAQLASQWFGQYLT
ncbi:MAG TPA: dienelactone hydrolase family protein [Leptolyngbyaceae cyanobacterium M65_K2018_010]|nr:dienelactone hydrolase family protein [Leptolyngbyaceae cyanobacterium M65_K2018_010]